MPLYSPGDIICRSNDWGEQVCLILDIRMTEDLFPDDVEYYLMLILKSPSKQTEGGRTELATLLVDKLYKLKA